MRLFLVFVAVFCAIGTNAFADGHDTVPISVIDADDLAAVDAFDQESDLLELLGSTRGRISLGGTLNNGGDMLDFGQRVNGNTGTIFDFGLSVPWQDQARADGWNYSTTYSLSFSRFDADNHTNIGPGTVTASQTRFNETILDVGIMAEHVLGPGVVSLSGAIGASYLNGDGSFFASGTRPVATIRAGYWTPVSENAGFGIEVGARSRFGDLDGGAGAAISPWEDDCTYFIALGFVVALGAVAQN